VKSCVTACNSFGVRDANNGIPARSSAVGVVIEPRRVLALDMSRRRLALVGEPGLSRGSWLDLDRAQHSEFAVFIGSSHEQLSLNNRLQAEQVNVWSVTHKDHWRRTTVAGD
jgi:hypothetical protein